MSKWEDTIKKKNVLHNQSDDCVCSSNHGLFVPNRQLSVLVAGLLFLFFVFFLVGYFLGKRCTVEQFTEKMHRDSFSDQVYASVISSRENSTTEQFSSLLIESIDVDSAVVMLEPQLQAHEENDTASRGTAEVISPEQGHHFYAQLIGFGTEKAAEKFVQKVAAKGIETVVKKHTSKTAKGRISHWYQVVTHVYADKNDLEKVVHRLTKEEMLKGVRVIAC